MLHFIHSRLCTSAADVVEVARPESAFLSPYSMDITELTITAAQTLI